MSLRPILLGVFLFAVAGCTQDRYEITQDKAGRTVRLDKRTGDVASIDGDQIIPVKPPEQYAAEDAARTSERALLSNPKRWPDDDITQIGVTSTRLVTSWRDGMIFYQLTLRPIPKKYDQSWTTDPFTLNLHDAAGFTLIEEPLLRIKIHRIVNEAGKPEALSVNSSTPCSEEKYKDIAYWSLSWKL